MIKNKINAFILAMSVLIVSGVTRAADALTEKVAALEQRISALEQGVVAQHGSWLDDKIATFVTLYVKSYIYLTLFSFAFLAVMMFIVFWQYRNKK